MTTGTSSATTALDTAWDSPLDADDIVREAMEWHFGPNTGSAFWLERAARLDFDPRTDVRTVADLALFPDLSDELRDVPVEALVPRGYATWAPAAGWPPPEVGESGGTTGAPKRVYALPDVFEQSWSWYARRLAEHDVREGANWLGVVPAGPHMVGKLTRDTAARFGGIYFTVDLDPRWAKRCAATGAVAEMNAYVEHMLDQIDRVLATQEIGLLAITPPLLELMCRREKLVARVNETVRTITWSGASMDEDSRRLFRTEVFPNADLVGIFGSAMIFCGIPERPGRSVDEVAVFDPPAPFSTITVVDPDTRVPVPVGERGQLVTHHVTRNMLLPNNLERDLATRHEHGSGLAGDAISEVAPVATFRDAAVVEGVY